MSDKILDALIAAKVPTDVILAVAKLIATAQVTEDRRAKNSERMRDVRARVRTADTQKHTKTASILTSFLPSLEKEEKKVSKKDRGTRIADDWIASAEDVAFARQHLPDDNAIADEEAKFRDYWKARPGAGGRKVDWSATWRNWVRNNRRPNGRAAGNGRHQETWKEKRQRETYEAIQQLKSYTARSNDTVEGDDPGDPFAGVIPFPKPA